VDRRDVDDRAAALHEQRERRAAGAHGGEQVELDHRPPALVGQPEEPELGHLGAGRRSPGVVDEDVESAVCLDGARDHLGRGVGIHEVGGHVEEVAPQLVELGGSIAGGGHDAGAFVEEGACDREADSLGCAGDDGYAV
jgi:hypothetical protein